MQTKSLAIIILNYNNSSDTIECLKSLSDNLSPKSYKIFLIDNSNAFCNELNTYLSSIGIELEYLFLERNSGFTEGNNIGIKKALIENFEHIMLLNNDTVVIDDSIEKANLLLQSSNVVDIIGLVNYYYSNKTRVWQCGLNQYIQCGLILKVKLNKENKISYCDYVPGSSIIIKREVFKKIGLLDENFFAYFEEIDFCTRAKKENFKIAYIPHSKILHKVGAASINKQKLYLKMRNSLYFYSKHLSKWNFYILFPKLVLKQVIKALVHKKPFVNLKAVIIGYADYAKNNLGPGSVQSL